jgi:hypothetical protein
LREERGLRVFENGFEENIWAQEGRGIVENFIMRSFMICTAHPILCG